MNGLLLRTHLLALLSLTVIFSACTSADGATHSVTATQADADTTDAPLPAAKEIPPGFIPPGDPLPTDEQCALKVVKASEVREANQGPNTTLGGPSLPGPEKGRVTGNFSGTTDEIIQWAACKWGLPADLARAQVATESWWRQNFTGDWTETPEHCAPGHEIGVDDDERPNECPESIGLLQIKYRFNVEAFPAADTSSAYNLDYGYAVWRACFEGRETWLNDLEDTDDYAAGDVWGCIGRWFSGAWYTEPAESYIAQVQKNQQERIWESAEFLGHG